MRSMAPVIEEAAAFSRLTPCFESPLAARDTVIPFARASTPMVWITSSCSSSR